MSFDKLVEEKIRQAMAEGEFDNLPGRGKPLNLNSYFATPEEVRVAYSMLKSAGFVPEEAQLLKDIEALRVRFEGCPDEDERRRLKKSIDEKLLKLNLLVERNKTRSRAK